MNKSRKEIAVNQHRKHQLHKHLRVIDKVTCDRECIDWERQPDRIANPEPEPPLLAYVNGHEVTQSPIPRTTVVTYRRRRACR